MQRLSSALFAAARDAFGPASASRRMAIVPGGNVAQVEELLVDCPVRILGRHGDERHYEVIWAIGFGDDLNPPTMQEFAHFRKQLAAELPKRNWFVRRFLGNGELREPHRFTTELQYRPHLAAMRQAA